MGGIAQMGCGKGRGEGSRGSAAVPGQDGGEQAWQERAGPGDKMGRKAVQTLASAVPEGEVGAESPAWGCACRRVQGGSAAELHLQRSHKQKYRE